METIKSLWARYSLCKINLNIKFTKTENNETEKEEIKTGTVEKPKIFFQV
jgi:hypothetical protein